MLVGQEDCFVYDDSRVIDKFIPILCLVWKYTWHIILQSLSLISQKDCFIYNDSRVTGKFINMLLVDIGYIWLNYHSEEECITKLSHNYIFAF